MVNEVESILNEIRARVRADHEPGGIVATAVHNEPVNGAAAPANTLGGLAKNESLSRLTAHLTTTARAWDRLPPICSNRKGAAARLELWLKARLKSMSRWFTWEQVNFNSAVHYSLAETLHALSAYQRELDGILSAFRKETAAGHEQFARNGQELAALRANIEALTTAIRKHHAEMERRATAIESRTNAVETLTDDVASRADVVATRADVIETTMGTRASEFAAAMKEINAAHAAISAQLGGLAGELRESDQELREEQRVCFRQLSLEASETSVAADRGYRVIESRLDKLEKALAKGEK